MSQELKIKLFEDNELLTKERLNELVVELNNLIAYLKVESKALIGDLNVTGALKRAGYSVYDTGNKPSSSEIGAVPISGSSAISGSLSPSNYSCNLGTSSKEWNYVYANYFRQNGYDVLAQISYSRTGYIKFSNNLKLCWGKFDIGGNSTLYFPSSFIYTPYVVACEGHQNKLDYNMNVTNITTSSFVIRKGNGGDHCYGCYIAIGQ